MFSALEVSLSSRAVLQVTPRSGESRELALQCVSNDDNEKESSDGEESIEWKTPRDGEDSRQVPLFKLGEIDVDGDLVYHFALGFEDAIGALGISAFCLFDTSGLNLLKLVLISMQCFFLQYAVLYYLAKQLVPHDLEDIGEENPLLQDRLILIVAVYLHIVNTITDIPFGVTTLRHFSILKSCWYEHVVTLSLFVIDTIVTPLATLVIGSLYLCTSHDVGSVVLNSCAVAFITNIDNWILSLNSSMNKMAGQTREDVVYLPYGKDCMTVSNWILCIVPVIPATLCLVMVHIGADVLRL